LRLFIFRFVNFVVPNARTKCVSVDEFGRRCACLLLLLAFFAQVALSARRTSITLDEPLHITSGYACLTTGDYRLVEEHPPLLKMLQAFPLLFAQPPLPDPSLVPGWEEGNLIQAAQHVVVPYRPIEPLVFAARVPTMLVGVLLAALVMRWATDAFGGGAGLFALVLYGFDPNMLAHAGVAATDLGAACAIFAAMYTFWRWLRGDEILRQAQDDRQQAQDDGRQAQDDRQRVQDDGRQAQDDKSHRAPSSDQNPCTGPSWKRMLVAAITLGLALGVKTTVLITLPIFALLILWGRPRGRPLKPYLFQASVAGGIAGFVLWSLYRFEIGPVPGVPFPVPAASHFLPLLKLRQHMREGHAAFLMGRNYHHGIWSYFPIAFALKTPLLTQGLLVLTAVSLGVWVWRRRCCPGSSCGFGMTRGWRDESAMLALPVLYFGISLTSGLNIGYRHLLPILPFLFVWVSRIGRQPWLARCFRFQIPRLSSLRQFVGPLALLGAIVAYIMVTLTLFPWYLAYFNLLAGGPDGGYRYLVDSNLDWGQTWKALHTYLEKRNITEFSLSQYTINDPRAYGLDYTPLPPWPAAPPVLPQRFAPPPGIYAISSTQLQGVVVADSEMFDYFRNLSPIAKIGHAMFVYAVTASPSPSWVAQCTTPVAPLSEEAIYAGFGERALRLVYFDCAQSWLIPEGNGWYGISRDAEILKNSVEESWIFLVRREKAPLQHWGDVVLNRARLAYEQKQPGFLPPFAIYEWFEQESLDVGDDTDSVYAAPSAWPPLQAVSEGQVLTTPINIGSAAHSVALLFLGHGVEGASAEVLRQTQDDKVEVGRSIALQTRWRIQQHPQQPFSLMAHLLDENGTPLAVGDGLGVSVDQLEPGDTLIQRHVFAIPPEAAPGTYWIQVGAYTYPDVERLPIMPDAGQTLSLSSATLDRLIVGQIEVVAP
jgi:hypothetical protein